MQDGSSEIDLKVFNELFQEYRQRFIKFAVSYTSDMSVAEDVVMESFTAAWENRRNLTREKFPAYILTAVKNKCLNHLRARCIRIRAAEDIHSLNYRLLSTRIATLSACDPEEVFSEETRNILNRTIKGMPRRTRDIFIRSRFDGRSYKEIAAEYDITVKSVEFEISKAMKILRAALRDYLPVLILLTIMYS